MSVYTTRWEITHRRVGSDAMASIVLERGDNMLSWGISSARFDTIDQFDALVAEARRVILEETE